MRLKPPRWYFPPNVSLPAHVASEVTRLRAADREIGGLPGGGWFIGGAPDDMEVLEGFGRWKRHSAGYLYDLEQTDPLCLLRVDPPQIPQWAAVIAPNGGRWRIPVLLHIVRDDQHRPVDILPAIPRVWRGDSWEIPQPMRGLAERLLRLALRVMEDPPPAVSDDALADLAIEIASLGHTIDREEVAGAGWLTDQTVALILVAACGESRVGDPVHDAIRPAPVTAA